MSTAGWHSESCGFQINPVRHFVDSPVLCGLCDLCGYFCNCLPNPESRNKFKFREVLNVLGETGGIDRKIQGQKNGKGRGRRRRGVRQKNSGKNIGEEGKGGGFYPMILFCMIVCTPSCCASAALDCTAIVQIARRLRRIPERARSADSHVQYR